MSLPRLSSLSQAAQIAAAAALAALFGLLLGRMGVGVAIFLVALPAAIYLVLRWPITGLAAGIF